jgi:hypothetical protein
MNDELTLDLPTLSANDLILAKEMADALHAHYPGHMWAVTVQGAQGVADIRNFGLSGRYGYRLRLVDNYSFSDYKARVIRAGGEILERYRVPRGQACQDILAALPTTFAGATIGDLAR